MTIARDPLVARSCDDHAKLARTFVMLRGSVSLFVDMTCEGARG